MQAILVSVAGLLRGSKIAMLHEGTMKMDFPEPNEEQPVGLLALIALLQGLALLLLHQAIELNFWPHDEPQWLFALYSVALPVPILLLLGLEKKNAGLTCKWAVPIALVLFCVGYYVGSQATPFQHINYGYMLFAYSLTLCVATFKVLMYIQQFSIGDSMSYSRLYLLSWRNFLTLGLSVLFSLCLWGVLMLWASLFEAIGISSFHDLFTERWFYYPALALAHGFGVLLLRRLSSVIDTVTRIQQALMKYLLVLLVFVSITFLSALPFTGLQPLWESGGSSLILWMLALMLFFLNAVYQDDPETRPYPLWMHRFIYIGIALLPAYCLISLYGLGLRVEQYGWTLSRCWASLTLFVFSLFSFGYLLGIVRFRDDWLRQLSQVNVIMGLLVLAMMFLVNSPLLDFRKISLSSQIARLERGDVSPEDFDYSYLRNELAGPGYQALQTLKSAYKDSHPAVILRIHNLYAEKGKIEPDNQKSQLLAAIESGGYVVPIDLGGAIFDHLKDNPHQLAQTRSYQLMPIDLDENGISDYLLFQELEMISKLTLFYRDNGRWMTSSISGLKSQRQEPRETFEALLRGEYELREPQWKEIEVGGSVLRVW